MPRRSCITPDHGPLLAAIPEGSPGCLLIGFLGRLECPDIDTNTCQESQSHSCSQVDERDISPVNGVPLEDVPVDVESQSADCVQVSQVADE